MNTAKLKAAAEKARWGDWSAYKPHSGARGYEVRACLEALAQRCLKDDAAFIAEASPKVVLELIAALEAAEKRVAELEARTLTVKLPDDGMDDCYDLWGAEHCRNTFDCGYNFSAVRHEEAIREACAVAGIKLQIEGV